MAIFGTAAGLAALLALAQPAPSASSPQSALPAGGASAASGPVPAEAQDPASTAVALHPRDQRMTVAVTIDGAGPFPFIVDSGATRTVISDRLARQLALPPAGAVALHSVGGETQVPSVRIAGMVLGGLPARPIVAPVLAEKDLGGAGILGIDALAGRVVVIDLAAERMSIQPSPRRREPPATGEIVVEAHRRYGQLVLADADAAGERIWAIVDTGSMVTIGNGPLQAKLVRRGRAKPQSTTITDVAGRIIPATYAPIADVRLGDWHVQGAVIAFSDAHAFERFGLAKRPAMLLGMDLLHAFSRVSIDFSRRTVRLLRAGAG